MNSSSDRRLTAVTGSMYNEFLGKTYKYGLVL